MAKKHNGVGLEYEAKTIDDIVDAVGDGGRTAEEIGSILWPHLKGGPARGGPSKAAFAATFQLHKIQRAGAPIRSEWSANGPRRWFTDFAT